MSRARDILEIEAKPRKKKPESHALPVPAQPPPASTPVQPGPENFKGDSLGDLQAKLEDLPLADLVPSEVRFAKSLDSAVFKDGWPKDMPPLFAFRGGAELSLQDGHNRWKAATEAGLRHGPVVTIPWEVAERLYEQDFDRLDMRDAAFRALGLQPLTEVEDPKDVFRKVTEPHHSPEEMLRFIENSRKEAKEAGLDDLVGAFNVLRGFVLEPTAKGVAGYPFEQAAAKVRKEWVPALLKAGQILPAGDLQVAVKWIEWRRKRRKMQEVEDPKDVFRKVTLARMPDSEMGADISGQMLRRLCSRYPVEAVYIQIAERGHRADGFLHIRFRNYGLIRQEWASFEVLAGALLRWRNLEGAPLYINGKVAGTVGRANKELLDIDAGRWRYGLQQEAEDPKTIFKQVVTPPPPPRVLLQRAVADKEEYLGKGNEWTSVHTNPNGETFCYGGFARGTRSTVATLLYFDRERRAWVLAEGEEPKDVFRKVVLEPHEAVRHALRVAGFRPTAGHDDRYEHWLLPAGRIIPNRDVEVVRYQKGRAGLDPASEVPLPPVEPGGDFVWEVTYYLPGTGTPTWNKVCTPQQALTILRAMIQVLPEAEDPKEFLKRMSQRLAQSQPGEPVDFGFAIGTADQYYIEANARDHEVELTDESWETLNNDSMALEHNCMELLGKAGIQVRDEGHDGQGDLVGSAWVKRGEPAWELVRRWVETDGELFMDASRIEQEIGVEGAGEILWQGVSELGKDLLDCRIEFFDVKEKFEEAHKPPPPPAEPGPGEDPKDFFRRMIATGKVGFGASKEISDVLEYMPPEFQQAFRNKTFAEWKQPDTSIFEPTPSFNDQVPDDDPGQWTLNTYFFDYYTEDGKLYIVAMQQDQDGNVDSLDKAEVGTEQAKWIEGDYGLEGHKRVMRDYWQWVIDHDKDPLNLLAAPYGQELTPGERARFALAELGEPEAEP